MKSIIASLFFLASLSCYAGANQSLDIGDGLFHWEIIKTYYSNSVQIGIQTNALTFQTDNSGCGNLMVLEQYVWRGSSPVYLNATSLDPQCGNNVTWAVREDAPWDFFSGEYDSTADSAVITWSNHAGTKTVTATTGDPNSNSYAVWADWTKTKGQIQPRITFGSQPSSFNHWLSNGQVNH